MHLYKHTKNCYNTDVELLFFNSSDCFIKIQTADITGNVGLSKYSSFCTGDLKLNDAALSSIVF